MGGEYTRTHIEYHARWLSAGRSWKRERLIPAGTKPLAAKACTVATPVESAPACGVRVRDKGQMTVSCPEISSVHVYTPAARTAITKLRANIVLFRVPARQTLGDYDRGPPSLSPFSYSSARLVQGFTAEDRPQCVVVFFLFFFKDGHVQWRRFRH